MFYLPPKKKDEPQFNRHAALAPDWPKRIAQLGESARDPRLQAFYQAGVVAADTPIAEVPLIALDFETTGLDSAHDDIISIGLVPMRLDRIRCAGGRHWVVRPRARLRSESVVIHGITHSEIEAAPDLNQILDELLQLLAGHVIVVHYRAIERDFLDAALRHRIGEGIQFPVIDTMELEARLHRSQRPSLKALFFGHKPVSIRLADSRVRYNLPYYRQHNALTDALACGELLQAQVAQRFSPSTPVSELWR